MKLLQELKVYQGYLESAIDWLWTMLPNLIFASITFFVGLWFIKLIDKLIRRFFTKKSYDKTLETFLQSFISVALKILLFVLVVTQLGVKTSSLVAMIGAAGLAIGLALQGALGNFAGGVLILIFKPFKVGDWISVQGVDGTVKEITIFNTKLNTFGNQVAIIPNGQLSNGNIINYNVEPIRRNKFDVGIGYGANLKEAKDILLKICTDNPDILTQPAPEVYVGALGDSAVSLTLRFWAKNEVFWPAHFYVVEEAKLRFDAAGIEIPFPQRVIHSSSKK